MIDRAVLLHIFFRRSGYLNSFYDSWQQVYLIDVWSIDCLLHILHFCCNADWTAEMNAWLICQRFASIETAFV
jgi:hypothetical protein